jgi:hypothetical protein
MNHIGVSSVFHLWPDTLQLADDARSQKRPEVGRLRGMDATFHTFDDKTGDAGLSPFSGIAQFLVEGQVSREAAKTRRSGSISSFASSRLRGRFLMTAN